MVYSAKKPYQKSSQDYVRFLKQTIGPESVFEKPYKQLEYTEMNQAPNVPTIPPPIEGTGGLICLYDANQCEITVGCYAGPGIKIVGGPNEAEAGYLGPQVLQGALINWAVQEDSRAIEILLDPSVARNQVRVVFKDGWGNEHEQLVDVICTGISESVGGVFGPSTYAYYTYNVAPVVPSFTDQPNQERYIGFYQSRHRDIYTGFPTITIDQGDTIALAEFNMSVILDTVTDTYLRLYGLDVDSAAGIADEAEWLLDQTKLTSAYATLTIPSGTSAGVQTEDVTSIVQEIINRPGWANGNSIGIFALDISDGTASKYCRVNHSATGMSLSITV